MKRFKRKGFTLIELIAVLVIMAILALIVTPLVISIIRSARVSADRRSIDAYGRSIELAIASYLLDNGRFPTEISELTIEYSGNEVVCEHAQLNSDSSVYLARCRVAGRNTGDYTYCVDKNPPTYNVYSVGDVVTYNNVDYYVIKDSSASESKVTLLKVEPLTVAEVNLYGGVGTENNHVNKYAYDESVGTAYDMNGYGGMAYYSSQDCGYVHRGNSYIIVETGCTTDYAQSEIKYVVDAWKTANASQAIKAGLLVLDDLMDNLGYEEQQLCSAGNCWMKKNKTENTSIWVYNSNYFYWINTQYIDSVSKVWGLKNDGDLTNYDVYDYNRVVRPVIVLPKSVL